MSPDPGTYCDDILPEEVRDILIRKGPEFFQNINSDFSETSSSFPDSKGKTKTRYLTKNIFFRKLTNGESLERKWLLYSPAKKSVCCYCCRLFNTITDTGHNLSSSNGYKDWKHISNLLIEHENSSQHREFMMKYVARMKTTGRIDTELLSQNNTVINYWKNVQRIVAVVKFLASRGLAFRGDNETLGSQNNGNYLGCLELISEFDPFLASFHIQNYGNRGKGSTSYLSANICNEFINLMGQQVLKTIVKELKSEKYYSISVDSTPDLSNVDQLTY